MAGASVGQGLLATTFAQVVTHPAVLLLTAMVTMAGVSLTFLIGGALLFSGKPQPTPFTLYPGLALVVLLLPMIVSLVLRLAGRGALVVFVTQAVLLLGNVLFWIGFLMIFMLPG